MAFDRTWTLRLRAMRWISRTGSLKDEFLEVEVRGDRETAEGVALEFSKLLGKTYNGSNVIHVTSDNGVDSFEVRTKFE